MLDEKEIPGFFAERSSLAKEDYLVFTYRLTTSDDPRRVAASLACEQSTAQWRRPGRDEDLRGPYGAKVTELKKVGEGRYEVAIAHPHRNFGPRLPNLLSAAAGEGPFYCPGVRTIKWTDLWLPDSFLRHFEGPQFGLAGLREGLGVKDRPFFVGVVKPNIGLGPADFAALAGEGWWGGLDICKDDEMLADVDWSPLEKRLAEVVRVKRKIEKETGERKAYIANITDETDRIGALHDMAVQAGADSVMINPIWTGLSPLRVLRKKSRLPIMSHFAGTAALSQSPDFGVSSKVLTRLQRLAGADIIGLAGFGERMHCKEEEVLENIRACLEPWGRVRPALPIPGGSDSAETFGHVFSKIGHPDFGFISGRGVFAHPDGPAAGARSLRDAWNRLR